MPSLIRLALYQPDIPQNTGACMRTAACFGVGVDIIGPTGFAMSDRQMKRAGMDYLDRLDWTNHESWETFLGDRGNGQEAGRLVLLTTKAETRYNDFAFVPGDTLLAGRESAGVPDNVQAAADARIKVAMVAGMRSLNVAAALAMVLGEALRQTDGFPERGLEEK